MIILQTHVLRLNHHHNQTRSNLDENTNALNITNSKLSMDCISIKFDEDINFHLLRHWSLYDSICHTHEMILSFKLWSSRGQSQLKEFLADLGIPKREYEQNYRDMNIKYKLNIKKQILDKRLQDKYHYTTNTIILPTFLLTSGFTLKLSPQDIVYSLMSTLQTSSSSSSSSNTMMIDLTERFSLALACLNCHQLKDYLNGIEFEKLYMTKTHYLIESLLQSDKNLSFDNTIPFIVLKFDQNMFNSSTTTDHTTSCGFFTHPYQAYLFARNALQILISYTSSSTNITKKKKSKHLQRLPLILIAPYSLTNSGQELVEIVVGVPALNSIMMNSFSTLFEAADRRCGNVAKFVFFDHSVLLLQEQHQQKFIDALMFVLAK
jgi:cell division control protein 45